MTDDTIARAREYFEPCSGVDLQKHDAALRVIESLLDVLESTEYIDAARIWEARCAALARLKEAEIVRINVYSQELTSEVVTLEKVSNTGIVCQAAQLILHSSPMLHHPPEDDDRSAVTFWLPHSPERREEMAQAFERIAAIFRAGA